MFEGALCRLDCWSNAQTNARPVGYFIWRTGTQMQLNLPSFLAFPSSFGFLPLFRHFTSRKTVHTASIAAMNWLLENTSKWPTISVVSFPSNVCLCLDVLDKKALTRVGKVIKEKFFRKTSAFESFYDSQIILATYPTKTIFFRFFQSPKRLPS